MAKAPRKTASEVLFEKFCEEIGVTCKSIATETAARTPDYELANVEPISPIAEVKQLDPSPDEKRAIAEFQRNRITSISYQPGKKVFQKITDAAPQLAKLARGIRPAILVLYNNVPLPPGGIDPYHVRTGMYGLEAVELRVPPVGSGENPVVRGYRRGGKEKVTPQHNTTLSAVAVLNDLTPEVTLEVYHNRFARFPLDPARFAHPRIRHFKLSDDKPETRSEWVEITSWKPNESARKGRPAGKARPKVGRKPA